MIVITSCKVNIFSIDIESERFMTESICNTYASKYIATSAAIWFSVTKEIW